MKTNKSKVQKKVAKKAAKKDLEKTFTAKMMEIVQQLAHDAEQIGVDIKKVGRSVSKSLFQKKVAKVKVKKDVAKANKAVKAAADKAKSVSRSVKVVPIVSVEKVEQAIAKKPVAKTPAAPKAVRKPAVKKPNTKTSKEDN